MSTALAELQAANAALQQAMAELVLTVQEDRPYGSDIAAFDDLAETVCEVQAAAAEARAEINAIGDIRQLPAALDRIDAAMSRCHMRYWRDLRSYRAVSRLRSTARGHGTEWQAWQKSLEEFELRCEAPLLQAMQSVHTAWCEIGELLGLYLSGGASPESARTDFSGQTG
jgi:hypothetical protein